MTETAYEIATQSNFINAEQAAERQQESFRDNRSDILGSLFSSIGREVANRATNGYRDATISNINGVPGPFVEHFGPEIGEALTQMGYEVEFIWPGHDLSSWIIELKW